MTETDCSGLPALHARIQEKVAGRRSQRIEAYRAWRVEETTYTPPPPPPQSAPDLQAGLRTLYEGRKAGEVQLDDVACTPENIQKPKKWWEKAGEWFAQNPTGQRVKNVAVGFLSGFIAGALTGAIGGAIVGSFAGGVGAGPGALGGAIVGGVIGGISGLVTGLLIKPDTPTVQVAKQAAIWGGATGLLGGTGASAAGLQGFAHGGQAWHIGLQTAAKLNIGLFGMFRDAPPYLATRRKAELIPPYIWRIATPIPNEPFFFALFGSRLYSIIVPVHRPVVNFKVHLIPGVCAAESSFLIAMGSMGQVNFGCVCGKPIFCCPDRAGHSPLEGR